MKPILAPLIFLSAFSALAPSSIRAADRPNILWITAEDYSSNWLGCYGNKQAQTPNIDELAAQSVQFTAAYSNAPVCAVARSTILTGAYAPTVGSQHMRSRKPAPSLFKPYVTYLRELGYHCTNYGKTDYNIKMDDRSIWEKGDNKAPFKNLSKQQPFFMVINLTETHESQLFPKKMAANRKRGIIPKRPRLDTEAVIVPPYLPAIPGIRHDIAVYHDNMTAMDTHVGKLLDELKKQGLADNTIVFHYSDHGGAIPRGKRYLKDTGTRVPMIVHFPKKWQHLSPFIPGEKVDEPVSFVDLAPTLLSLLGEKKPDQMLGRAFLGSKRIQPAKDEVEFLYADRFDEIYSMRRGITDGRWKYIRRFTPHLSAAPYSFYQFGQAGWIDWENRWKNKQLKPEFNTIWQPGQAVDELFDLNADPWEIHNLAADPTHAEKLKSMRSQLKKEMIRARDTGLIPEGMFAELVPKGAPTADYWKTHSDALPKIIDLAFLASARHSDNLPVFVKNLTSSDPLIRYWAAQGVLIILSKDATSAEETESVIAPLLKDKHSNIRTAAAQALIALGKEKEGITALLRELQADNNEFAQLSVLNALIQAKAFDQIPADWKKSHSQGKNYVSRCISRAEQHGAE